MLAMVVVLAGCVTHEPITRSSGVAKLGPDTYTVSTITNGKAGGEMEARQNALGEANRYCADQKLEIVVTSIKTATGRAGTFAQRDGHASLIFRCLVAGDPDLKRPDYQPIPSTVIEDRRTR
jgi:hypothetical protein